MQSKKPSNNVNIVTVTKDTYRGYLNCFWDKPQTLQGTYMYTWQLSSPTLQAAFSLIHHSCSVFGSDLDLL